MKTSCLALFLLSSIVAGAQTPGSATQTTPDQTGPLSPTAYSAVEQGANHRVWERTLYDQGPNGTVVPRKQRYTELASGLNFKDPSTGQWQPSKEEIDILPNGGAAATRGAHRVYFPSDIAQGVIEMVTPDGRQLQSRPVALAYDDGKQTVLFAILTNSVGELTAPNEVTYPNAFEGASLRYTYTKAGFEQDVIVQGQLPTPDSFGLNTVAAKLLVMTEFFDTNNPVETSLPVNRTDGLSDTTLTFGTMMKMVGGRAFSIGTSDQSAAPTDGTPTYKSWVQLNGRKFLIEQVSYPRIAPQLQQLPMTGRVNSIGTNRLAGNSILGKGSTGLLLPPSRGLKSEIGNRKSEMIRQLARTDWGHMRGLVLDYKTINPSVTNYVFEGDMTYYISGSVYLFDTTTIEGGTVIKYANTNYPTITIYGAVNCQTAPYHPAVFTAKDDNSVGQGIDGSTGSPAGYYAAVALLFYGTSGGTVALHDLRISYANDGVLAAGSSTKYMIRDCQICQVGCAIEGYGAASLMVENTLIYRASQQAFNANYMSCGGAQLTVDQVGTVCVLNYGTVCLTNSLLVAVTNSGNPYTSVNNATNGSSATVFQTVGAASHYLAVNSPYTNAGTANIDPELLTELATKTTYPPIVYSNCTFSIATNFSPQAQRDTNSNPDLGYHYDPIDYFFGGVVAQSNVTFTAGTAAGWFELPNSYGNGYGISLTNGMVASFGGTATRPCWFARYSCVQEGGNGLWVDKTYPGGIVNQMTYDPANPAILCAGFTRFAHLCSEVNSYRDGRYGQPLRVKATDCEFYGASGGYNLLLAFTNCLFYRGGSGQLTSDSRYSGETYRELFRNCTFYGGTLAVYHWEDLPYWQVSIRDCSFDGTAFDFAPPWNDGTGNWDWAWLDADYNATNNVTFVQNADLTALTGPDNVHSSGGFNWQSNWFGNFYLPTNSPLINAGDRTADQVGLFEFTTQTNQTKDGISPVDIGYHYVATDQSGDPLKTFTNNAPDYLMDADGDGLPDWWEMNYFGNYSMSGTSLDMYFRSLLYDYQNGINPNNMGVSQVLAWGDNSFGQCNVPQNISNAVAVAANGDSYVAFRQVIYFSNGVPIITVQQTNVQTGAYSLALKSDGSIVAWGDNSYGQTNIPSSLTNIVAISAGSCHGLALDSNRNVHTWGNWDTTNEYNVDSVPHSAIVPSGISDVVAIAAGRNHDVALRSDGTVLSWGYNTNAIWVMVPTNLPPTKEVAAGWSYSAALLTNGTIVVWAGDLSAPTNSMAWPIPASLTNAVSISGGPLDILVLKADGNIIDLTINGGIDVSQITNAVSVADGYVPGLVLDSSGTVWILANSISSPNYPLSNIITIAAGWNHALAIRGGLLPPFIVGQPVSQIVGPGTNFTLSVQVLSYVNPSYRWQFNGTNLPDATNAIVTLTNVQSSNSGLYCCIVANNFGEAVSSNALVTIVTPPAIVWRTMPTNQVCAFQTNLTLGVTATAPGQTNGFPLSYQWQFNGANIDGRTSTNCSIFIDTSSPGTYSVIAANVAGSTSVVWQVTMTYEGSYIAPGTLAYYLSTNAVGYAYGYSATYSNMLELANWTSATYSGTNLALLTNAVWSTNCWLHDVAGLSATCIGYSNGVSGKYLITMVSPRHYLRATHLAPGSPPSDLIAFLDTNNVIHWRKAVQQVIIGNDTDVGILDADLPALVGFLPIIPADFTNYLPTTSYSYVQGIGLNQLLKLFSQPMTFQYPFVVWNSSASPPFGLGADWDVALYSGDSSNPDVFLIDNRFVYVSHHFTVDAGPNYAYQIDAINQQMHYLSTNNFTGTDYQLTLFSLTNWPHIH